MKLIALAIVTMLLSSLHVLADERSNAIQEAMWSSDNQAFNATDVPEKWKDKSAIILAKLNRLEYKKPILIGKLQANNIYHMRIKLNDKSALNEYAEISFPAERRGLEVYTGFKLIKPDGREVIIDNSQAVEMEMKERSSRYAYKKMAIPGLEAGDILDYYIYREETIPLSTYMYYFDPVQYYLPQEYPVVEQHIEFKAQRRCFISLKSSNGAPQLKERVEDDGDDIIYTLVDKDREEVKEMRWFHPYRELPCIKFRAAYASGKAMRQNDVLLGKPGEVKSEVSNEEMTDFLAYVLENTLTICKPMVKYVKKNQPKRASNFEKAKAGFYFRRNEELGWDEENIVTNGGNWGSNSGNPYQNLHRFTTFLAKLKIPHDIVIAIPRDIASIDDLLLEHEMRYLLRVKQGDDYLYLSPVDHFCLPGDFNADLMGTEAYVVDGNVKYKKWQPKRITLPVIGKENNYENSQLTIDLGSDMEKADITVEAATDGYIKKYAQYSLLDYYDCKEEESAKFEMSSDFMGSRRRQKELMSLRESVLNNREKTRNEALQEMTQDNYDFKVDTVGDFRLVQSGRFDTLPEMKYSYTFSTKELVKKAGRNYIVEIGKLIQKQTDLEKDELERHQGIFQHSPRSYAYTITLNIPDGYIVQGIDKLNTEETNPQGGFISTATQKGSQLILKTEKYYNNLYDKADTWPNYIAFMNAAANFSSQKLLLKKK
ncbi:DUF3857 domain-containing protein [Carboxylicivirga taeanensis]|uniref:DUF3857 domain-containing protein n=1 Tax=Carboxylicivirga taeanensis TaxID=1416875 RepID=UPI003F6E2487